MSDYMVFGWVDDPVARSAAIAEISSRQAGPVLFSATQAARDATDDETSICLWLAEKKVRGSLKKSWNQKQVGSCVSFGWGRAINDTLAGMAARGEIEMPPVDVATEPIYGGSRVEVGGGRISGDGSVGAWAADWVSKKVGKGGVLLRQKYGTYDLSEYSESLCRQWGRTGVPDSLEPIARQNPVKEVSLVITADDLWKGVGSGYAGAVCSNQGFTTSLVEGFCSPSGQWGHCMEIRGRVVARRGGRRVKAFPIQNSWANYLSGDAHFIDDNTGEKVELPEGCFLADFDVVNRMLAMHDSFLVSDVEGFPKRDALEWLM